MLWLFVLCCGVFVCAGGGRRRQQPRQCWSDLALIDLRHNWCLGCVVLGLLMVCKQQDVHAHCEQELGKSVLRESMLCIGKDPSRYFSNVYIRRDQWFVSILEKKLFNYGVLFVSSHVLLSILRKPQYTGFMCSRKNGIPPCKNCCK